MHVPVFFGLSRMNNVLVAVSTYSICFLAVSVTSYFAYLFAKCVLKFITKDSIVNAYRCKDIYIWRLKVISGLFRHFFLEWNLEVACPASQRWIKSLLLQRWSDLEVKPFS